MEYPHATPMDLSTIDELVIRALQAASGSKHPLITAQCSLSDLGFDSLAVANAVSMIERATGCELAPADLIHLFELPLVGDVIVLVSEAMRAEGRTAE